MVVALSNLILLLPIAGVLAIMLAMTGNMVLRPRDDSVRVFVQIVVWQFALLGLIGLMARSTLFSLVWVVVVLGFLVQLWFWERGLARSIVLLVFGTTCKSADQLPRAVHYLMHEGRGYWRRLGRRFDYVWRATSSWELAFRQTGLARPARLRLALANLVNQPDTTPFHRQIAQVSVEQRQTSQWLGRLTLVSLSYLLLLTVGVYDELHIGPMLERVWHEMAEDRAFAPTVAWKTIVHWKLYILIPVIVWGTLLFLYMLKKIPMLARHRPFAWLLRSYYRSLTVEGLAEGLKSCPDPVAACSKLAEAMPVPSWSQRLKLASQKLAAGQSLPSAFVQSGLLKKNEAAPLELCRDAQSTAWALHELGQNLLERTLNRTHVNVQLLTVALTLVAAVMITLYAISTFGLLIALAESQL